MMLSNKNKLASGKRAPRTSGFTLIEILVVIAISIVLFGILIRPLIDSLRYSQDAQRQAAAQDSTRKVMEMLSRELGSAAFVFDSTGTQFNSTKPSTDPNIPDDQYTNFLDLDIPTFDTNGNITGYTVGHAYGAKLDYAMARRRKTNLVDPTADLAGPTATGGDGSIDLKSGHGTAVVVNADVMLPIARGTTMVRWWIGLQNPQENYVDSRDKVNGLSGNNGTNTYVLYRAQFSPYNSDGTVNTALFDTDASGKPFIDDPDFFRNVKATDVNWNSPAHAAYGSAVGLHNTRVANWQQIAKPIINAPSVDMLVLPHNADRTVAFDTAAPFTGIAHFGATHDPVSDTKFPTVHTTVDFQPGIITADAAPAASTDYSAAGVPQQTDAETGLPYVPTTYATAQRNWSQPFTVYLYPVSPLSGGGSGIDTTQPYFYVTTANQSVSSAAISYAAGDLVEHRVSVLNGDEVVFDFISNVAKTGVTNYVPLSLNTDLGTINFNVPALPAVTGTSSANKFWIYTPDATLGTVDLKTQMTALGPAVDSPLSTVDNAIVVPGSVTVYGPDMAGGPGAYDSSVIPPASTTMPQGYVQYTPTGRNVASGLGPNQYQIDYVSGMITVEKLSTGSPAPLYIAYSLQANASKLQPGSAVSSTNIYNPYLVKVEYHSRDVLSVDLGVRYFNSDNSPQTVSLRSELTVGNANR